MPGTNAAGGAAPVGRVETALALAIPAVFFAIAVIKAWPFVDDVPLDGPQGDDWYFYKTVATSIVRDGLSVPTLGTYTLLPHGFLYNYFVAGVFSVFGVNAAFVYVIQAALVGASVSLLWLAARGGWSRAGGIAFLLLASVTLYVDFVQRLSFRLLSENLFLFLAAAFVLALAKADEHRSHAGALGAGALLGLAVLSRTSVLGWALGVVLGGAAVTLVRRRPPFTMAAALAAGFVLAMCLLPLREYAAIGRANFDLITHTQDWVPAPVGLAARAEYYGSRVLFTLGATEFVNPDYRPRPHWMLIWAGAAGYLAARVWWRWERWPGAAEACVLAFIPLYLGPVLLVSGIDSYGGRMVAVAMPLAAVLIGALITEVGERGRAIRMPSRARSGTRGTERTGSTTPASTNRARR